MKSIEIDKGSGFCFGVVNAIQKAEEELARGATLYCLGDIVHNAHEVERLRAIGLITIDHEQFKQLRHAKVLLRAHGEPPETYEIAKQNDIEIIDATCPVVLQLQRKIKKQYQTSVPEQSQILIFGKNGHAEVNGLVGQTQGDAIVIETLADLDAVDFTKPIHLYAQTTKSVDQFKLIIEEIQNRLQEGATLSFFDTICRQVANRIPNIRTFAAQHDLILFVSGKKSSNGKVLFEHCLQANPNSHMISDPSEIDLNLIKQAKHIGICGATSTPKWLMDQVATFVQNNI